MPLPVISDKYVLKKLSLAGSYALDVNWADGHGSIYPFRELRAGCPCPDCRAASSAPAEARARSPEEIEQRPDALRILWEDGHETALPWRTLRDLCACALCAGERGPIDSFLGKR